MKVDDLQKLKKIKKVSESFCEPNATAMFFESLQNVHKETELT